MVYLGIIIALSEIINRLTGIGAEFTRKIVHIGSGNVILIAWWFQLSSWVLISASLIASIVAIISYFLPILPSINSVGRKSLGTFFYAVSIGVLAILFWQFNQPQYAVMGVLVMAWGDGMAAIIGQNFGQHPYQIWGINKSLEGSLTMMGISFMIIVLILLSMGESVGLAACFALVIAITITGLEAFSKWGIDNLTVPLGTAILAFYLTHWL
ncbi:MAG TPA: phosphatidate cytidylyltransferase [Cyanothece sp. UBA12306]|nr:phosphatidate cytidylyltransferase [Cyanothece sp. UBA12306]